MATVTPPPAHAAAQPRKRRSVSSLFSFADVSRASHQLKLRHSFKVDEQTRLELGLDMDVDDRKSMVQTAAPWASVLYQLDAEDAGKGSIEVNPLWATYNRSFTLGREGAWWEVPLDTKLGLTYSGKPHVEVGIRRLPVALTLAAVLLAAGKPISVKRKEVGGLALHFPITVGGTKHDYSMQERVEVDATLRRQGAGLKLDFHQINGVLRLRQD